MYMFDGEFGLFDYVIVFLFFVLFIMGVGVWGINFLEWSDCGYVFGVMEEGMFYCLSDYDLIIVGVFLDILLVSIDVVMVNDFYGWIEVDGVVVGVVVLVGVVK